MLIKKRTVIWWILFACGVLASLVLLVSRFSAESNDKNVAVSLFMSDIAVLSAESGMSAEDWLSQLAPLGVEYIVFDSQTDPDIALVESYGLSPAFYSDTQAPDAAFLLPRIDNSLESSGAPIALVEDIERSGVMIPDSFDISTYSGDMVKTLYMYDSYRNRWTDENAGEEIENLLFRACVERGSRLILLRPFTDASGSIISAPDAYSDVLLRLSARLERYNIQLGEGFSCMPGTINSPVIFALASFLTAALWIALLVQIEALKRFENILCILAALGLAAAHFIVPDLCRKALPFLCGAIFPCIACLGLKIYSKREQTFNSAVEYLILLGALLGWGLFGGLSVSALMSHRIYLMGGAIFSGVKASQMLPLALCFFLFLPPLYLSLKENHSLKRLASLAAAALVSAFVFYFLLIRSGDTTLGIGSFETAVRNFLEETLYARPRTKEIFFAVPLSAIFVFASKRKLPLLCLLCALCASLECVSLINTFCHATAPILISLVRGILGAIGGLILGVLLLKILEFSTRKLRFNTK